MTSDSPANGTTPGNGKIGYGPIPGYMQKCAGCGLVIGHPSTSERCPCETPMPPGEDWCSPLRAPPKAHHLPSEPPARCTCPDDSRWLADGSCDRCGAPAMRVYERAEPARATGRRPAPTPESPHGPPMVIVATPDQIRALVKESVREALAENVPPGRPLELTSEQAAHELGLAPKTLRRMAREGRIAGELHGQQWRFKPGSLAAYREGGDLRSIRNLAKARVAADLGLAHGEQPE